VIDSLFFEQYEIYMSTMKKCIPSVIVVNADDAHPDGQYVEVYSNLLIISLTD
jgi:hypothetical protein